MLQTILNTYEAGLQIVAVQLQEVQPPKQVIDAFKDVASAREDKARFINEAEGYRSAIIPEVRGRVEMILREAEAYREEKIRRAQGETQRFLQVLGEYQHSQRDYPQAVVIGDARRGPPTNGQNHPGRQGWYQCTPHPAARQR